jgi:Mitochondrial carrier protein
MHNQNSENKSTQEKSLLTKTLESGIAGLGRSVSAVGIHPLEVIKTRLQTLSPIQTKSIPWVVSDISKNGMPLLYRGFIPSSLLVGFKGFYKYPLFVYGPQLLAESVGDKNLFSKHPIFFQCAMTPFIVGIDTALQGPLRRLRNIGMTSDKAQTLRSINHSLISNPLNYWRGSAAAAAKQSFGVFTSLLSDALIRNEFKKRGMDTSHKNPQFFGACILSGATLALLNTPLDVVASRTSSAKPIPTKGFLPSLQYIYKTDGYKAFTKGAGVRVMMYGFITAYTGMLTSWGREEKSHSKGRE